MSARDEILARVRAATADVTTTPADRVVPVVVEEPAPGRGVTLDLFAEDVFVFTPKGEQKHLPHRVTPLDFAYAVHTDVGHKTVGAKVNGKIVPLKHRLKSGDTVEVDHWPHTKTVLRVRLLAQGTQPEPPRPAYR